MSSLGFTYHVDFCLSFKIDHFNVLLLAAGYCPDSPPDDPLPPFVNADPAKVSEQHVITSNKSPK